MHGFVLVTIVQQKVLEWFGWIAVFAGGCLFGNIALMNDCFLSIVHSLYLIVTNTPNKYEVKKTILHVFMRSQLRDH